MTASTQRIEVITRGERRRRWSIEEKREIVAASLQPGVKPSEIIQRHGITSGQLYAWRQQLTRRIGGDLAQSAPSFARVAVETERRNPPPAPELSRAALGRRSAPVSLPSASRTRGLIEIVLPGGASVRVDAHVDDHALRARCAARAMITPPAGVRVYLACGHTDMRKGMATLAMLVQQTLGHDPFCGTVYAFRGRRSGLIKLLWHDGVGLCLFIKRLERGQFIWPMSSAGTVSLSAGQLSTLLEGCEWRASARNLRPELAG